MRPAAGQGYIVQGRCLSDLVEQDCCPAVYGVRDRNIRPAVVVKVSYRGHCRPRSVGNWALERAVTVSGQYDQFIAKAAHGND